MAVPKTLVIFLICFIKQCCPTQLYIKHIASLPTCLTTLPARNHQRHIFSNVSGVKIVNLRPSFAFYSFSYWAKVIFFRFSRVHVNSIKFVRRNLEGRRSEIGELKVPRRKFFFFPQPVCRNKFSF